MAENELADPWKAKSQIPKDDIEYHEVFKKYDMYSSVYFLHKNEK